MSVLIIHNVKLVKLPKDVKLSKNKSSLKITLKWQKYAKQPSRHYYCQTALKNAKFDIFGSKNAS